VVFGGRKPLKKTTKLFIIGEAPGKREDQEGYAFIGKAGKLLNNIFEDVGQVLILRNFFITNVVACRPPNNRDPKMEEIENCKPRLLNQINHADVKAIVTLGKIATCGVLGMDPKHSPLSVFKWHKKTIRKEARIHEACFPGRDVRKIPVYATYHPAFVLRQGGKARLKYRSHIVETIIAAMERTEGVG
jgi:DNA polymerase